MVFSLSVEFGVKKWGFGLCFGWVRIKNFEKLLSLYKMSVE